MDSTASSSPLVANESASHSDYYSDSSVYEYPFSTAWLSTVPLIESVISIVTVIGNIMVIVAYIRDQRIRANVANLFILNLAITDLLVGAFIWNVNLQWLIKDTWVLGETFCKAWLVLDYTAVMVSVLTMVMISWDRYCLVTMGMRYQSFQTKRRITIILTVLWAFALIWYTALAYAWGPITGQYNVDYSYDCEMEFTGSFVGTTVKNAILFFIPLSVLVGLNIAVYANIRRRSRGVVGQSPSTNPSTNQLTQSTGMSLEPTDDSIRPGNYPLSERRGLQGPLPPAESTNAQSSNSTARIAPRLAPPEAQGDVSTRGRLVIGVRTDERTFAKHRRAAAVLAILVGCYLLCWVPYQVSSVMLAICGTNCVTDLTWEVTNALVWCNSTINPFIYAATNVHFRRNFKHYLLLDRWACDIRRCKVKRKP